MATRTGYVGTQSVGDVLTSANFTKLPNGCLGYATATANQGSITTVTDLTGLTLTLTPGTSRLIRISWSLQFTDSSGATTEGVQLLVIKDGSQIDRKDTATSSTAGAGSASAGFTLDVGPTSASHTYRLQAGRTAAAVGTLTLTGTATAPAFFAIFDDGPSF